MKKFIIGAGLASTVVIGSLEFTGGNIIDQVNSKVAGMFEMISTYESNETKLVNKINELKESKMELKNEIANLNESLDNKDIEISNLNSQVEELERQIEILDAQLENKKGLAQEITRLENEVNKANNKVAELQNILERPITDKPLTEIDLEESFMEINGEINLKELYESGESMNIGDYAKLNVYFSHPEERYSMIIQSINGKSFEVEHGRMGIGIESSFTCSSASGAGKDYYKSMPNEGHYIKINEGEFIYKIIVDFS